MVEKLKLKKVIEDLRLPAVISFGNPLLDIVVTLNSNYIFEKYGLKVDGEVELPQNELQDLLDQLPPELVYKFIHLHF